MGRLEQLGRPPRLQPVLLRQGPVPEREPVLLRQGPEPVVQHPEHGLRRG